MRLRDEYPSLRNINALSQDTVGRVWIATEQGLFIGNTVNSRKFLVQPVEILNDTINHECVQTLLCDKKVFGSVQKTMALFIYLWTVN